MMQYQLIINTDGGSRGNPGQAAIGVCATLADSVVLEHAERIGVATNNVAEYAAITKSLDLLPGLLESLDQKNVSIEWRLDSLLVVEQLNKRWKIKDARLRQMAEAIWRQLEALPLPYTIVHVARENNSEADRLVNYALDNQL